jgi:hypothetical protein
MTMTTLYENIESIEKEVISRAQKLKPGDPKRSRMIIAARKFKDYRLDLPVNEAMQKIDTFEFINV